MTPRSPDLAIFVLTDRQTDKTDCFTPCACARGNERYVQMVAVGGSGPDALGRADGQAAIVLTAITLSTSLVA